MGLSVAGTGDGFDRKRSVRTLLYIHLPLFHHQLASALLPGATRRTAIVVPQCLLLWQAMDGDKCIGCVVNKLEMHAGSGAMRGYIAMLAVDKSYRKLKIGAGVQRTVVTDRRFVQGQRSCGKRLSK